MVPGEAILLYFSFAQSLENLYITLREISLNLIIYNPHIHFLFVVM